MAKCKFKMDDLAAIFRDLKVDLKQNIIIQTSPLSLKYVTVNRTAILLWESKLRSTALQHVTYRIFHDNYSVYETEIVEGVSHLKIPANCKESLKTVVDLIGKEILSFSSKICICDGDTLVGELQLYWKRFCWTEQATINSMKTAANIIEHTDLAVLEKEMAANVEGQDFKCYQNLVVKLRFLNEEFPEHFVKCKSIDNKLAFLVLHTKTQIEWFIKVLNRTEYPHGCFLSLCSVCNQECTLQYIWEEFANDTEKKQIVETYIKENLSWLNTNIYLYLCTKMNLTELEMASKKDYFLVEDIYSISRWSKEVSFINYVFALMKTKDLGDSFNFILYCWQMNFFLTNEYFDVFCEFIRHFKVDSEKKIICTYGLRYPRNSPKKDMVTLSFFFRTTSAAIRKKLIYHHKTFCCCINLITNEGLKVFDDFIDKLLKADEISKFKNHFFNNWGLALCREVIQSDNYELVDEILFKYCDEEKIRNFKHSLFFKRKFTKIFNIDAFNNRGKTIPLKRIDRFCCWCFDDKNKMDKFGLALSQFASNDFALRLNFCNVIDELHDD